VFLTLSATAYLPVEPYAVDDAELRRLDHVERDLVYNPDRHLSAEARGRDDVRALVERKQRTLARRGDTSADRRGRFQEIRSLNASLQPWVAARREALAEQRRLAGEQLGANRILGNREFSFCLYPEHLLREFYAGIGRPST
jgi:hypothetical protein